jgi:transcriptional regulator with XRE-family HTH domain/quercetin dioxygenase-like cupin family protein
VKGEAVTAESWRAGAELGPRLRRVREERGLSVRELARRVSCSASLVSQFERGLSAPSVGVLYALATELGASLDFLFGVATSGSGTDRNAAGGGADRNAAGGELDRNAAGGEADRNAAGGGGAGHTGPDPLATANGEPGGQSGPGTLLAGHGIVQRAAARQIIDLASGVRWERLTPAADQRVDFLKVVYQPGGHSTDARRPLRHDGYEYGLITEGRLRANVGFESYELGPGDSIAFDSATPHEYWNTSAEQVHAVWVVVHARPGLA